MEPHKQRVPLETAAPETPPAPPAPAPPDPPAAAVPLSPDQIDAIRERIVQAIKTCYDPEIPVNVYELGLIYGFEVSPVGAVEVRMTLTSPACPAAGSLPPDVRSKILAVPDVTTVKVDVVWDPPWTPDRMTEAAKLQLGMF